MKEINMKKILTTIVLASGFILSGCYEESNKRVQSKAAMQAAESVQFTENSEIENIKRRLEITSKVGQIGYVVLFNEAGSPILYTTIKGKVTSGGKRLTREDEIATDGGIRKAASDEGTYGSSNPYIFFFDTRGVYHQWSGAYLYSTQPIRLRVEPIVVQIDKN
jgi:hypothetical protein